jgi:hypothetical protein
LVYLIYLLTSPYPLVCAREFFLGEGEGETPSQQALSVAWRALVLSIAVCYYFRLDSQHPGPDGRVRNLRRLFLERFKETLGRPAGRLRVLLRTRCVHACPSLRRPCARLRMACVQPVRGGPRLFFHMRICIFLLPGSETMCFCLCFGAACLSFEDIVEEACTSFFMKCKIPRGAASALPFACFTRAPVWCGPRFCIACLFVVR